MALDLFAGIAINSYAEALPWYEQFFGARPSFLPNDTEAVWEVAEHRYVYIVQQPERAGNALVLSFVDDLGDRVAGIARRGIEPARRETYSNGVPATTPVTARIRARRPVARPLTASAPAVGRICHSPNTEAPTTPAQGSGSTRPP